MAFSRNTKWSWRNVWHIAQVRSFVIHPNGHAKHWLQKGAPINTLCLKYTFEDTTDLCLQLWKWRRICTVVFYGSNYNSFVWGRIAFKKSLAIKKDDLFQLTIFDILSIIKEYRKDIRNKLYHFRIKARCKFKGYNFGLRKVDRAAIKSTRLIFPVLRGQCELLGTFILISPSAWHSLVWSLCIGQDTCKLGWTCMCLACTCSYSSLHKLELLLWRDLVHSKFTRCRCSGKAFICNGYNCFFYHLCIFCMNIPLSVYYRLFFKTRQNVWSQSATNTRVLCLKWLIYYIAPSSDLQDTEFRLRAKSVSKT